MKPPTAQHRQGATGMADAASRTVGSASQTADLVIGTAGSSNRMAEASNRMGG